MGNKKNTWSYRQIDAISKKFNFSLSESINRIPKEALEIILLGGEEKFNISSKTLGLTRTYNIDYEGIEIFIKKLKKLTPNIKYDLYGMEKNQPVWADNFINKISNSKMGLNLSQGKPVKFYSSDRFAQLIGNGLLVFIDEKTKINEHLNNKEIVTYKNLKDLAEKIIKYNKNDRIRKIIAKNGRDKYHKYFNSEIIAQFIVSKTLNIKTKKFYWEK